MFCRTIAKIPDAAGTGLSRDEGQISARSRIFSHTRAVFARNRRNSYRGRQQITSRPEPDFRAIAQFSHLRAFFAQSRKFLTRPGPDFRATGAGFPNARAVFRAPAQICYVAGTAFALDRTRIFARAPSSSPARFLRTAAQISNTTRTGLSNDRVGFSHARAVFRKFAHFFAQSRKILTRPGPNFRTTGAGFPDARAVFRTFAPCPRKIAQISSATGSKFSHDRAVFRTFAHFSEQSRIFATQTGPNFRTTGAAFPHARAVYHTFAQFFEQSHEFLTRPELDSRATGNEFPHTRSVFRAFSQFLRAIAPISNATGRKFPQDRGRIPGRSRSFAHICAVFPHSRANF